MVSVGWGTTVEKWDGGRPAPTMVMALSSRRSRLPAHTWRLRPVGARSTDIHTRLAGPRAAIHASEPGVAQQRVTNPSRSALWGPKSEM